MGKRWPALDVDAAEQMEADHIQAIADDFGPTAIEDTAGGLRFFFSSATDRDRAAVALNQRFRVSPIDVPDDDWARRCQENLPPIAVGRLVVAPPWHAESRAASHEPRATGAGVITIVIAPSMGFGTGHHATTRLCLAALQEIDLRGASVLDVGTGSGVLALAAVHLGAAHALGVDNDADAVQSAVQNLALNPDVRAARISFVVGDLMSVRLEPADVVAANLTGGLLIRAAERLQRAVRPGGILIMSGLQSRERDEVWRAFSGLDRLAEAEEDGWTTFTARNLSNSTGGSRAAETPP